MARARYFEVATDTTGRPIPSATVNVYQAGTTTPIAETIYAADSGVTTLANPIVANAQGEVEFYLVAPKRLDLRWVKTGYTTESHPADVIGADLFVLGTEKGSAGGVATLDGSGLVPIAQLPNAAALDAEVAAAVGAEATLRVAGDVAEAAARAAAISGLIGTYVPSDPTLVLTYNGDGTLASVAETAGGTTITTTFTYNSDGTLATSTRLGVTRTYSYTSGNLVGVA